MSKFDDIAKKIADKKAASEQQALNQNVGPALVTNLRSIAEGRVKELAVKLNAANGVAATSWHVTDDALKSHDHYEKLAYMFNHDNGVFDIVDYVRVDTRHVAGFAIDVSARPPDRAVVVAAVVTEQPKRLVVKATVVEDVPYTVDEDYVDGALVKALEVACEV